MTAMRGRNQDSLSVIENSIKVFGLVILFFVVKYILMGFLAFATLFGIFILLKEIFSSK
jgi:hypothetical protein